MIPSRAEPPVDALYKVEGFPGSWYGYMLEGDRWIHATDRCETAEMAATALRRLRNATTYYYDADMNEVRE